LALVEKSEKASA